jgi:hypothetical protein
MGLPPSTCGHSLPSYKVPHTSLIPIDSQGASDGQLASGGDASAGQVGSSSDKTFVFVGDKMSGKTSLIAKLLDEPVKDDMKETTALDFRYGTRVKEEKKQKINIYELGN